MINSELKNEIINGDSLKELKKIPNESFVDGRPSTNAQTGGGETMGALAMVSEALTTAWELLTITTGLGMLNDGLRTLNDGLENS